MLAVIRKGGRSTSLIRTGDIRSPLSFYTSSQCNNLTDWSSSKLLKEYSNDHGICTNLPIVHQSIGGVRKRYYTEAGKWGHKVDNLPSLYAVKPVVDSPVHLDAGRSDFHRETPAFVKFEDHISSDTKVVWNKSMNDYVFKSQSPGGELVEIPMMQVLRSTLYQNFSLNSNNNSRFHYRNHRVPNLRPQQIASFSTGKSSNDDTDNKEKNKFQSSSSNPPNVKLGTTQIPTPSSAPPVRSNPLESLTQTTPKNVFRKGIDMTVSVFQAIISFLFRLPGNTFYYATHSKERQEAVDRIRKTVKDEVHHYWVGTKLLWADIKTAQSLLTKTLHGSALTRRERRQLLRTVSDLFRLIPFSMFVIIPFMEFALPFALKIFPNMLPSTYQDSLKAEEDMKRELKTRIAMAQFFQETLEELAKEQKQKASKRVEELQEAGVESDNATISKQKDSAASMLEFLSKARSGEMMPPEVIIRYAKYFQDDLTLDNMPRMQLINMCRYMSIPPYGNDNFLRFQLRMKIRSLKEDDQRILWEGINSLTKMELREACQERGMRSTGLSKEAYKRNLQQWLDLSVNKDVPISLLIMSRTFFLQEEMLEGQPEVGKSFTSLADTISGLDREIVNEVILEVATAEEKVSDRDVLKIKLEVLAQQNELIKEEAKAREESAKKKEATEKLKEMEIVNKEALDVELTGEQLQMNGAATPIAADISSSASSKSDADMSEAIASKPLESMQESKAEVKADVVEKVEKVEKERSLSIAEMDAISQLITNDPVSSERADLEKIKAAMKSESKVKEKDTTIAEGVPVTEKPAISTQTSAVEADIIMSSAEADKLVTDSLNKMDKEAAAEAEQATHFDLHPTAVSSEEVTSSKSEAKIHEEEEEDDPIVARLKKRVESMVGKIQVQLTETKVKIGDKLHFLDKDKDGVLTLEEMVDVLQSVLKRELPLEVAKKIASEMDHNNDGVFTVAELQRWIDENKLVQFFEEGRDAEVHKIIESVTNPPPSSTKDETTMNDGSVTTSPEKIDQKI